jgi:methyl-accepting chemotaxis protein
MSLFVSFVMLFSLIVISAVFILSERQKIASDIVKNGIIFANSTINKIYDDYVQFYTHPRPEDFDNFKTYTLETLKNNQDIEGVGLIAYNGRVLFDSKEFVTGKAATQPTITDPKLLSMLKEEKSTNRAIKLNGQEVTEIIIPLPEPGGGHVISARYVLSNRSLTTRMNEIYRQLALVTIPLMIFVSLIAVLYTISFTKPIRAVTKAAEDVRAGNLDVETKIKGKDEIGTLASIFDEMVANIKNSRAELEKYSKTLETQVADRTKQVEESKKALEEKLDELGRMNNLMVGREVKMTELKAEIDKLKGQSSDSPPTPTTTT